MGMMNRRMNLPAIQKIMREFEQQNERMEMTSDAMGVSVALDHHLMHLRHALEKQKHSQAD
jgi:division protein CdvB (Snf7/Vps24/ESCRT-III family)